MKQGLRSTSPRVFHVGDIGQTTSSPLRQRGPISAPHLRLAPRERMVFDRLLQGKLAAEIARELGRSEKTIQTQRVSVMNKLGVMNLVELGIYGARWGLVQVWPVEGE
jgi:DNA-binding NarL/FixJ family response regulator